MRPPSPSALLITVLASLWLLAGCHSQTSLAQTSALIPRSAASPTALVVQSCQAQTQVTKYYDSAYSSIAYPGGDVAADKGVCSDVIVRAFRAAGVDLQQKVHEDMKAHFHAYPDLWHLKRPDPNIDHRRVANLMCFFQRHGKRISASQRPSDFQAGDVVAWRLPNGRLHIGIVSGSRAASGHPEVVHNIGAGTQQEDVLFAWPIIGHYRYFAPKHPSSS